VSRASAQAVSVTSENDAASAHVSAGDRLGPRTTFLCRYRHQLGHGPREVFAQEPVAHAQRMLARAAEFAGVIGDARIDEHAIAGLDVGDTGADGLDHPRAVGTNDKGKSGPRSREVRLQRTDRGGSAPRRECGTRTSPALGGGASGTSLMWRCSIPPVAVRNRCTHF